MDKYAEILAEIEHSDDPQQVIQALQQIVCAVCEDGPPREGILWAAAYLAALSDYTNPRRLNLLTDFSEVAEALNFVTADVQQDQEAEWALWRATIDKKHTDKEKEDD